MRFPGKRFHLAVTFVVGLGAVATAATLVVRDALIKAPLRAGAAAPPVTASALGAESGGAGGRHVILFSNNCSWCAHQLRALRELPHPYSSTTVLVALARNEAPRTPAVPGGIDVAFVDRAALERQIGKFGTPAHIWIDRAGNVTSVSTGFKDAAALRRFYAERGVSQPLSTASAER